MNEKDMKKLRKKLYVNREVQLSLILKSVLHWFFYICAILLTVVAFTALRDPSLSVVKLIFKSFVYFSPGIIASVVLLPFFLYDILKSSHRVAGPIHRLRGEMQKLAHGEDVEELRFRDGDHWMDLADDFNVLAYQLMEARRIGVEPQQPAEHSQPEPVA